MASQIDGAQEKVGISVPGVITKAYILSSGPTREYTDTVDPSATKYRGISPFAYGNTFNQINGSAITESGFNALEAGLEVVTLTSPDTLKLDTIGLSYIIPGAR